MIIIDSFSKAQFPQNKVFKLNALNITHEMTDINYFSNTCVKGDLRRGSDN